MSALPSSDSRLLTPDSLPSSQQEALWRKVDQRTDLSEGEKAWYRELIFEVDKGKYAHLDWDERKDRAEFYLKAGMLRTQIIDITPREHRPLVHARISDLLDETSGGLGRKIEKEQRLQEMWQAMNEFLGAQQSLQQQTRRISFLPAGYEDRLYQTLQKAYLSEDQHFCDLEKAKHIRRSVEKAFENLARIAQKLHQLRGRLSEDPFLLLKDDKSGLSMEETLLQQFESQLQHWADSGFREDQFGTLLDKQMPAKIKKFNEVYRQVYDQAFWDLHGHFSPQEFPNLTTAFNFAREEDFLHQMTLKQIQKKTKDVHEALLSDSEEILDSYFPEGEKRYWQGRLKKTKKSQITKLMKEILLLQKAREKNERAATRDLQLLQRFERRRYVLEGFQHHQSMVERYGKEVFSSLHAEMLSRDLLRKYGRVMYLQDELPRAMQVSTETDIKNELMLLEATFYFPESTPQGRKRELKALEDQCDQYLSADRIGAAEKVADKMAELDALKAYQWRKRVEKAKDSQYAVGSREKGEEETEDEPMETSADKQMKLRFMELCIEHAEKVKEECEGMGIPTDDPDFWGQEGVRNRVKWLKDNHLYGQYEKYNASDPNIPKDAQAGGFRFRWLDGRGADHLSRSKAEDGIKYLQRYKEAGYRLCALAGAFSIGWKGSGDSVYDPDKFIEKMRGEMTKI